jgi:glycosyltransferase involved in cell wall biosynthesis
MKVLILSAADQGGGAFIAARRLHFALIKNGIESILLLAKKTIDGQSIVGPQTNIQHTKADIRHYLSLPFHKLHKTDNPNLHSFNVIHSNLHSVINDLNPDVVNLHWVNREMMSIADIGKITAPIVWTLHDMWPLLGTAHYEKFESEESVISSHGYFDLDEWMYSRKRKHWSHKNITFVGPSQWMSNQVKKSKIFNRSNTLSIMNAIDSELYKPHSKNEVRAILGLNADKKYILFGAMTGTSDPRKGFLYLKKALKKIQHKDIELLIFGGGDGAKKNIEDLDYNVHFLGRLYDDVSLKLLYNAADVFVTSSLLDNLPNTIVESLSCGTPVVAFNGSGGVEEMIKHKVNGYLADYKNDESLATGIDWVLDNSESLGLAKAARDSAEQLFTEAVVAKQYMLLFESLI